ncbi:MAG: TolC family protein [Planctomycetes bacterium]|nr:TolC family protein [Planctomycetota bacterium]
MRHACFLAIASVLAGCASLDPADDLDRASSLVETRADTPTGWTSPWHERSDAWDGHEPLAADVAVRVALQNNRSIRREVETIVASRADYVQAHLLPNPVINFAYGFPTDGLGGNPLMATVMQQIAWLWRRPVEIDAAEATLRARILAVSDAALTLVADVRRSHAAVVSAERAAALQQENVALIERTGELLRERLAVGEASRLDVNRVELDLRRARAWLADREATLAGAQRALLERLGRAADHVAWRTEGGLPDPGAVTTGLDESSVIELASTQRLDVIAATTQVQERAARLDLAEQGRAPDVTAGVSYQQNFADRPGWFPTVQVTPKIFDDNSARVARALSELRQAEIAADGVRQAAVGEARRAWVALRAQVDAVRDYEQGVVEVAEQNLTMARAALDSGEHDLSSLLDTQRVLVNARLELTDRRRAAADDLIELERAVGGTLSTAPRVALNIAPQPSEREGGTP